MKQDLVEEITNIFSDKFGWIVYGFETENDIKAGNVNGQIQINADQIVIHLVCEIRKLVIPSSIPSVKQTIENLDLQLLNAQGAILLANYISTKARELLYQSNINYADTGGNIFLKYNNIHIYIETGRSDRSALTTEGGRAFTKAGLKVLYQFFRSENKMDLNGNLIYKAGSRPGADLNSSYKNIALQASVSKDTVSKVILDLLKQGYILRKNSNEYTWREKKAAFERWVSRINEIVRPSLYQRKYRFIGEPIVPENIPDGYQFGGYYGAQRWLGLKPSQQIINATYLIYTHKAFNDIVQDLKTVPDPNGNVTVIKAFWQDDSYISPSADFPVLYADLIYSSDPRMLEIAQLIYKNYIDDYL